MKDYKLLLAGLILLLLIIFIAIFTWLWTSNRKNADPLPIMASDNGNTTVVTDDDENALSNSTLHIQAEESLQVPLDDVIVRFEARYPHVQVLANYVSSNELLTLSNDNSAAAQSADSTVSTDIIIANGDLSTERLATLQTELNAALDKNNQTKQDSDATETPTADDKNDDAAIENMESDNTEARTLNSFNYALRDEQALKGVILTDNAIAVNFRNFLLSSAGQSILKKYDYYNIDGYQNSIDDLFNPTSRAKKASGDSSVDIADAISIAK